MRPTLDWAALQVHALRRDGHPSTVQWQGRFARARGARPGNLDDGAVEVVTEFDQDVTAKTVRVVPKPGENKRPHTLTRIYDAGVEVGEIAWVPSQKLLMWSFKGLTKGSVTEEALKKTPSGGWTFQPSLAWANVQALAFYTFHTRLAKAGTVSVARERSGAAQSRPARCWSRSCGRCRPTSRAATASIGWTAQSSAPAATPTIICYAKAGCNQYSWYWPPSMSWACTGCNSLAAFCFYSTIGITTGTCVYMPASCSW